MFILCLCYVYINTYFVLFSQYIHIMFIVYLYHLYIIVILCLYYFHIIYILCLYYVYIMFILSVYYLYIIGPHHLYASLCLFIGLISQLIIEGVVPLVGYFSSALIICLLFYCFVILHT